MAEKSQNPVCRECQKPVAKRPTVLEYQGQEIFLFDPVVCGECLEGLCRDYASVCVNCGGAIPPYSQVGVLKSDYGQRQLVHMSATCSTVGSAFHGYWGKGKLHNFIEIEAC